MVVEAVDARLAVSQAYESAGHGDARSVVVDDSSQLAASNSEITFRLQEEAGIEAMEDALATRSGPRSVGATLRALDSVSIALGVRSETSMAAQREREADRDRQQA